MNFRLAWHSNDIILWHNAVFENQLGCCARPHAQLVFYLLSRRVAFHAILDQECGYFCPASVVSPSSSIKPDYVGRSAIIIDDSVCYPHLPAVNSPRSVVGLFGRCLHPKYIRSLVWFTHTQASYPFTTTDLWQYSLLLGVGSAMNQVVHEKLVVSQKCETEAWVRVG